MISILTVLTEQLLGLERPMEIDSKYPDALALQLADYE